MSVSYRTMRTADIPAGVSLVELANWNQTQREWELFLHRSPSGCAVAELDGSVVGTVTTIDFGPFAWISMVLVHPDKRGHGIGAGLMREALRVLGQHPCVRLDATPLGEPVYRKLGFDAEYPLLRMERNAAPVTHAADAQVLPLASPSAIDIDLDLRAFDADRTPVLHWLHNGAPELAFHIPGQGFVLGRRGRRFTHLGPLTASGDAAARALVLAALPSTPAIIDVPLDRQDFIAFLRELGFRDQRPLLRMSRGAAPPNSPFTFAIAGPELG